MSTPRISVVIPTYNRAQLLMRALTALRNQSLEPHDYEVIVVDDGSTDATPELVAGFWPPFPLTYRRLAHGGISLAKNVGTLAARSPLVLYADDDDEADPELLAQHLAAHEAEPADSVAVLGYTTWSPTLTVTPVMQYLTEIGQLLFAYPSMRGRGRLDYTAFWGGRSSCKRRFLLENGVFHPAFTSIIEDIELGYRLSRSGLSVVFNERAASYMLRRVTFEEFCERSWRRGRALVRFSALHPTPEVRRYCGTEEAADRWAGVKEHLPGWRRTVAALEEALPDRPGDAEVRAELHRLYASTFEAYQLGGMVEEMAGARHPGTGGGAR
ncbi:glycosyltransferase [Geodermatophilus sp. SYSU D00697]